MSDKKNFPKMVYHPTSGEYLICDTEEEIPEGYVSNLRDVRKRKAGKTEGVTLESLELTRKEATTILVDEGVEFAKNASSAKIAALVNEVLEDGDSK